MAGRVIKDKEEELHYCILKGSCPYCRSKQIKYREYLTNQRFGFECQSCGWQEHFSLQELVQFSQHWI